jgi:four helix bundle protein
LDDFEFYRKARMFRKNVYKVIKQLPPEEKCCLGSQMRRAGLSVSNNIAEGHGRWYYQDNLRFCRIARGSVDEVIDDLNVCFDEDYAPEQRVRELKAQASELLLKIQWLHGVSTQKQTRIQGYLGILSSSLVDSHFITHLLTTHSATSSKT